MRPIQSNPTKGQMLSVRIFLIHFYYIDAILGNISPYFLLLWARHLEKYCVGTFSGVAMWGCPPQQLTTSPNQREVSSPPSDLNPNASKPSRIAVGWISRSCGINEEKRTEAVGSRMDLGRLAAAERGKRLAAACLVSLCRFQVSERWRARGATRLQLLRK